MSPDKKITPRLFDAVQLVFDLFGHDARKSSEVPVLSHLFAVCSMVQFDGGDEDEAVAALLHDTLEDKPEFITRDDIKQRFGERVLKIIEISTDTPPDYKGGVKPPWRDRKTSYLNHARRTPPELLRITIADKIDNARAILAEYQRVGDQIWSKFNAGKQDQIWYYNQSVQAYDEAGCSGPLLEELRRLVNMLNKLTA